MTLDKAGLLPIDVIKAAFPNGTQTAPDETSADGECNLWQIMPDWPPDLFGICTHLLEQSGAYHHLTPGADSICKDGMDIVFDKTYRENISKHASAWRQKLDYTSSWAQQHWKTIVSAKRPISARINANHTALPGWWRSAMALASFADETSECIGHCGNHKGVVSEWMSSVITAMDRTTNRRQLESDDQSLEKWFVSEGNRSICMKATSDVFCVQPKSKTPSIGCTIRSTSQNLALLPGAGVLQAGWQFAPVESLGVPDKGPLNCLFIPYPYEIDEMNVEVSGKSNRWRWFEMKQGWLPDDDNIDEFIAFVDALVRKAAADGNLINGIIFPEYSLNWRVHQKIVAFVLAQCESERNGSQAQSTEQSIYNTIEFVISGSSDNCNGESGNFILTTQIFDELSGSDIHKQTMSTSRAKHHRWQMTNGQIKTYDFGKGFKNGNGAEEKERELYWEKITIPRRRFHAHSFRDRSVFSTLICEDLARAEPVHKFVRAIGPNIIFVLLMDGCQIEQRWPARYAMGLAEDPGSAVVTLTSRALIKRSNLTRAGARSGYVSSWSVGLARNPYGDPQRVDCDRYAEAVVLKFTAKKSNELTIDGRRSAAGWNWSLSKDTPTVSLDRENMEHRKLLNRFTDSVLDLQ